MREIKMFCDICGKEFPPQESQESQESQGYSILAGTIIRIDAQLEASSGTFEGHYCGEDTKKILEHIEKLTNEARTTNRPVE